MAVIKFVASPLHTSFPVKRTHHEPFSLKNSSPSSRAVIASKAPEEETTPKFRSIILLNAITIVYASNIAVVKEVEEIMDPAAFSVVRFVMAAIPFTPFVLRSLSDAKTRNSGI